MVLAQARVDSYVPLTRELCRALLEGFADKGHADAAADYAQQIPVRVIARILGVSTDMADTFTGWVRDVLEFADDPERRQAGAEGLLYYFVDQLAQRKEHPGDDLLSELLHTEVDGKPVDDGIVLGMAALVLIAGVDTTWSAIGSSLWHLATHEEDRKRLVAEPELMPTAVEELLRAYSPVTMAREVTQDVEYAGCPMKAGDKVLMNFPAANRDPEAFEDPDVVLLDRAHNRHVAFGSGIHRCAGSNLARMELQVALEEWLDAHPRVLARRRARRSPGRVARCAARVSCPWCSHEDPRRSRQVPGARPLLRPRAGAVRRRRLRAVHGDRRRGAARARGQGASGHRQLPRVRHRDHQRVTRRHRRRRFGRA